MNELERMIAKLNRPAPSEHLDDRIGTVVMASEWGIKRAALRATLACLFLIAAIGLRYITTEQMLTMNNSRSAGVTPPNPLADSIRTADISTLVLPTQTRGSVWGADKLLFQVAMD